ncbi:uncharacterized protein VTP21DRAFT_6941 [Calcarisporiella thermophila]|uniref:uncharacterized protein n=1 Tax=Calcarisporiella thermophila TaxID=911321 RepID=UPI0037426235
MTDKSSFTLPRDNKGSPMEQQQNEQADPSVLVSKLKSQLTEHSAREAELLCKLKRKEEEVQTLLGELQSMAQKLDASADASSQRRFLDPALNALYRDMKKEIGEKDEIIANLRDELDATSFTPNSMTGKRLVAKCRALQLENEELGRQLQQGRVEQYETEILVQRKLITELRGAMQESDDFVISLDHELEEMQDIVLRLQAKLSWYEEKYGPIPPDANFPSMNDLSDKLASQPSSNETDATKDIDMGFVQKEETVRDAKS